MNLFNSDKDPLLCIGSYILVDVVVHILYNIEWIGIKYNWNWNIIESLRMTCTSNVWALLIEVLWIGLQSSEEKDSVQLWGLVIISSTQNISSFNASSQLSGEMCATVEIT